MSKIILLTVFIGVLVLSGIAMAAEHPLINLLPENPLVIISGEGISRVYARLTGLDAVVDYGKSKDHEEFEKSKLALKLRARIKALSSFVGHNIDMKTFLELSGEHTVFALYDIGTLRFLMVSDISVKGQTALAYLQNLNEFETRKVGKRVLYVKEDPNKGLAFALYKSEDKIILSNDVTLLERTLLNMERVGGGAFVNGTHWRAAGAPDDKVLKTPLVLYLNMERLLEDRYFRFYWVYRNREELKFDKWTISGIRVSENAISERRIVYGRKAPAGKTLLLNGFSGAWQSRAGKGDNPMEELSSFFGWKIDKAYKWDSSIKGRLFAFTSKADNQGIVAFSKGAVFIVDGAFNEEKIAQGILKGINDELLIIPDNLKFEKDDAGYLAMNIGGFSNCFLFKADNLMFIANDREMMKELRKRVSRNEGDVAEEISISLDGEIHHWITAFKQMGPSAAFSRYDIGNFFFRDMTGLLSSFNAFGRFSLKSVRNSENIMIQTVIYEQ